MDCKKVINQLLLERNITINQLAENLGMQPQSLRNKISRNNYSVNDLQLMLSVMGCHLQVVTDDTKKVFD